MGTQVNTADAITVKKFSAALFQYCIKTPNEMKNLTGAAPQQSEAERKIKGQTSAGMPIVRVTDLASSAGDKVSIDLFNIIGGKPIMGDRNAEGRGQKLSSSSFNMLIDLATFNVDAGGKMSRQRTRHDLRRIALEQQSHAFGRQAEHERH